LASLHHETNLLDDWMKPGIIVAGCRAFICP
jgi:hypothetical protein